jgi:hypothetical protein
MNVFHILFKPSDVVICTAPKLIVDMLSIAYMRRKFHSRRFGGVVVSVLAIGPKVREFKPGPGDEFLRAMQIRSMSYFRGVAKP